MTVPTRRVSVAVPNGGNRKVSFTLLDPIILNEEIYEPGDSIEKLLKSDGTQFYDLWVPDEEGDSSVRYRSTLPNGTVYTFSLAGGADTTLAALLAASQTALPPDSVTQLVADMAADFLTLQTSVTDFGDTLTDLLTNVDLARLAAASGSTSASLRRQVDTLRVGCYVVIDAGTVEAELRRVTSINGTTITWSLALDYAHADGDDVLVIDAPTTMPQWFGAAGDGATLDGDALRAWAAQHRLLYETHGFDGLMYAPDGVYLFDLAPHPDNPNIPVGFWSSNLRGQSIGRTIFKLDDAQTFFGTKNPYLIGNYEVGTATTEHVTFSTFTLDGNAAAQVGMGWAEMSGVKFTKTRRGWALYVLSKNVYSTGHTPDTEGFTFKWATGADGGAVNCISDNDDGADDYEASGFSMSTCINMRLINCIAQNSPQGNCFTANKCRNLVYVACIAQRTADVGERTGFNLENSQYVLYSACIAGGYAHALNNVYPYSNGEDLGCRVGWVFNNLCDTVTLSGCQAVSSTVGLIFKKQCTNCRIVGGCQFVDAEKGISIDITDGLTYPYELYIAPDTVFTNCTNSDVNVSGGVGGFVWRGYSTPSMPSSGAAFINPYPADVMIGITGGTVTQISVKAEPGTNYRPMAAAGGVILLPVGGGIKLTYSVAPTWYWLIGI